MKTNQVKNTSIVVLGVDGMLGHKVFEVLSQNSAFQVCGTVISAENLTNVFPESLLSNVYENVLADQIESVDRVIIEKKPDVVVNCIGIIKQSELSEDWRTSVAINALFPHQLAQICDKASSKLITISTDCVFDGKKGGSYDDDELPTCHDVYGMSKYLGEVHYGSHLTLRTSLIGHELFTNISLLDWFLSVDQPTVLGYRNAIFSGFTTLEFAELLEEKIIPSRKLCGLYQVSTQPISKLDLLNIISRVYEKKVEIIPDGRVQIDRSLNSDRLKKRVSYASPEWETLIQSMYQDFLSSSIYQYRRKAYES